MAPGMFLSHPPTTSRPSMLCALHAVSIESAMTSRETREYFIPSRSEEHTSELQSRLHLVCRLLLEKKKKTPTRPSELEPLLRLRRSSGDPRPVTQHSS